MGVADFPIEIFKAVKKGNQAKTSKESSSSTSGVNTPVSTNQSVTSLLSSESVEVAEPTTYFPSNPSVVSTDTGDESTVLSSVVSESTGSTSTPRTSTTSNGEHRSSSLKEALRGTFSKAASRSNSRDRGHGRTASTDERPLSPDLRSGSRTRTNSHARTTHEFDPSKLTIDNAIGAGKGIQRIVAAGMKSPMDFTLGIARGFHNAPKLYGDDTVRPQEKVTDFQSGLRAAGKVNFLPYISIVTRY